MGSLQCYICEHELSVNHSSYEMECLFRIDRSDPSKISIHDTYECVRVQVCGYQCSFMVNTLNAQALGFQRQITVARQCFYCYEFPATHTCGNCNLAVYCTKTCQRADWKRCHHMFCKCLREGSLSGFRFPEYDMTCPPHVDKNAYYDICFSYEKSVLSTMLFPVELIPQPNVLLDRSADVAKKYLSSVVAYRKSRGLSFNNNDIIILYIFQACTALGKAGCVLETDKQFANDFSYLTGKLKRCTGRPARKRIPLVLPGLEQGQAEGRSYTSIAQHVKMHAVRFDKQLSAYTAMVVQICKKTHVDTFRVAAAIRCMQDYIQAAEMPHANQVGFLLLCSNARNYAIKRAAANADMSLAVHLAKYLPRVEDVNEKTITFSIPESLFDNGYESIFCDTHTNIDMLVRGMSIKLRYGTIDEKGDDKEKKETATRAVAQEPANLGTPLDYYVGPSHAEKEAEQKRKQRAAVERRLRANSHKAQPLSPTTILTSNVGPKTKEKWKPVKTPVQQEMWKEELAEHKLQSAAARTLQKRERERARQRARESMQRYQCMVDAMPPYAPVRMLDTLTLDKFSPGLLQS